MRICKISNRERITRCIIPTTRAATHLVCVYHRTGKYVHCQNSHRGSRFFRISISSLPLPPNQKGLHTQDSAGLSSPPPPGRNISLKPPPPPPEEPCSVRGGGDRVKCCVQGQGTTGYIYESRMYTKVLLIKLFTVKVVTNIIVSSS